MRHTTPAPTRTPSLLITSLGLLTNTFLALYLLSSTLSPDSAYKWEPQSEWESTSASASWLFGSLGSSLGSLWPGSDSYSDSGEGAAYGGGDEGWGWGAGLGSKIDGVKLLWGLLVVYFGCAACVCGLGVWGVLKTLPPYIRFYRDYTIASLSFSTFFLALATYGAFSGHSKASLCESLSHYPELVRDLQEKGVLSVELTLENCEGWLEGAVVVGLAGVCLVMAVRLHFLLAVSNYYSYITRYGSKSSLSLPTSSSSPILLTHPSSKSHLRSKSHSHSSHPSSSHSHPHGHSSSHPHGHSPSRSHTLPSSRAHAHASSSGSSSSTSTSTLSSTSRSRSNSSPAVPMQRIYLLPASVHPHPHSPLMYPPKGDKGDREKSDKGDKDGEKEAREVRGERGGDVRMVYAPVPLDSLPLEMQVQAMEAWVHTARPSHHSSHSHSHSSHPHPHSSGSDREREREKEREREREKERERIQRGGTGSTGQGAVGMGSGVGGSHQRWKSHRRRSSSVLTVGQGQGWDKGKHEA